MTILGLIVACGGNDSDDSNTSLVGNWQLTALLESGIPIHNSCDLESYMSLTESNTGTYYQYYSDDLPTEPCGLDATYGITWSQGEGSNYLITFDYGGSFTAVLTSVLTLDSGDGDQFVFVKNNDNGGNDDGDNNQSPCDGESPIY